MFLGGKAKYFRQNLDLYSADPYLLFLRHLSTSVDCSMQGVLSLGLLEQLDQRDVLVD